MDKVLQTGLTSGMAATAGFHGGKPNRPSREHDGKNTKPVPFCPDPQSRITFPTAKEPVKASHICIGAWAWGDKATWGWSDDELPALRQAWEMLYKAGINFIDSAEAYGHGKSEEIIGQLVADLPRDSYVIQTKYFGGPFVPGNYLHPVDAPLKSLRGSLDRMGLQYVDIYLVHGPIHPQSIESVAQGMAKCVEEGLARAIGVANYHLDDVRKIKAELAKYNVPLATNQCEFSLLRRYPELNGDIAAHEKEGIIFQSYSSLAQGRLSGKYTVDNPPPKTHKFSNYKMEDVEPTLAILRRIGEQKGKTPASVALNYNISKGALPVVGIRNPQQAQDAIDALGWRLTDQEVTELDKESIEGYTTALWQQG